MDNTDHVVLRLVDWHEKKVAYLKFVSESAKEGTTFKVGDSSLIATKREAFYFQLGIEAALVELGQLPIKITSQGKG